MVICKYFQSGYCRFGSKCVNEHFDVKQYIKTEVEAALKGSQWPLSCFGLFKEKPCIPNFIEDQCYEEVRLMCYNARKENCFPAYQQQFTQQVMEAQNKMKTLLSLRREVVDAMIKLYDDAETAQKGGSAPAGAGGAPVQAGSGQTNPFSLSSSALGQQQNSGGLFGAASNQMTSFSGQGLSGGGILAQSSFGGNTFGGVPNQGAIFGGQQQQPQQPQQQANAFSFNQVAQPSGVPQQGGNIFSMGAQPQQQASSGGSIFGGAVQQQPPPQQPPPQQQNIFGGGNVFGGTSAQTNLFGQAAPVQQQQQQPQQQQQNLFGQTQQQPQSGFGAFGQTQTPVGGGGGFGVQQQQAGLFGQPSQQSQQPQMQMQQPQMQMQQPNQQQQQQPQGGIFGAPQQNLFGQQPPQQQASAQGNMFGAAQQQAQIFNMGQQQNPGMFGPQSANQPNSNVFGQIAPQFQQVTPQQQPNIFNVMTVSDTVYSKLEDLTPEEIEAFKAPEFILGKIPTKPPPRELV